MRQTRSSYLLLRHGRGTFRRLLTILTVWTPWSWFSQVMAKRTARTSWMLHIKIIALYLLSELARKFSTLLAIWQRNSFFNIYNKSNGTNSNCNRLCHLKMERQVNSLLKTLTSLLSIANHLNPKSGHHLIWVMTNTRSFMTTMI